MTRGESLDTIPPDLFMEILSRLPAKSIVGCRCVSKRWNSMFLCPYFTDLFKTKTLAQPPRLLLAVQRLDGWHFMTSPQPQNPDEESLSLATDLHMKSHGFLLQEFGGHAFGFIHLRCEAIGSAICNPSTGQCLRLPLVSRRNPHWEFREFREFLGFDPIDKQFKVLAITVPFFGEKREPAQILTVGKSWRKIQCPLNHDPSFSSDKGICINGVLYYLARKDKTRDTMIVCFDVRSEKFKFIYRDFNRCGTKLVDYKGRLGMIVINYGASDNPRISLRIWLIKDVENPESEWSEYFSYCWDDELVDKYSFSIVGMTARGDIVMSKSKSTSPFCVFYIYPKKKTIQLVKIQSLKRGNYCSNRVEVFADYVENLNHVNIALDLQQDCPKFGSINKFDALRLSDDDDECT